MSFSQSLQFSSPEEFRIIIVHICSHTLVHYVILQCTRISIHTKQSFPSPILHLVLSVYVIVSGGHAEYRVHTSPQLCTLNVCGFYFLPSAFFFSLSTWGVIVCVMN